MKKTIIWLLIIIIVLCGGYYVLFKKTPADKEDENTQIIAQVSTVPATIQDYHKFIDANGVLNVLSNGIQNITMQGSGIIKNVLVSEGDEVKKGQYLVKLIATPAAYASLQNARNNYIHQLHLRKMYLATTLSVQNAHNKLLSLQKKYGNGQRWIKTPFAGVVSKINLQRGQVVSSNDLLFKIENLQMLGAKLAVTPKQAAYIKNGDTSVITIGKNQFSGKVINVPTIAAKDTGLITIKIKLKANLKLITLINEPLDAVVYYGPKIKGIALPRQAVLFDEKKPYIYLDSDNKAVKRYVTILGKNDHKIFIKAKGLPGSSIVAQGNYVLQPNMLLHNEAHTNG